MTRCSCESRAADTTKSFTGESSLTSSIVQTWAATTEILLKEKLKVEISSFRLKLKMHEFWWLKCVVKKFQIYIKRLPHTANSKLKDVQRSKISLQCYDLNYKTLMLFY